MTDRGDKKMHEEVEVNKLNHPKRRLWNGEVRGRPGAYRTANAYVVLVL